MSSENNKNIGLLEQILGVGLTIDSLLPFPSLHGLELLLGLLLFWDGGRRRE